MYIPNVYMWVLTVRPLYNKTYKIKRKYKILFDLFFLNILYIKLFKPNLSSLGFKF